jgi:hypothetical protein
MQRIRRGFGEEVMTTSRRYVGPPEGSACEHCDAVRSELSRLDYLRGWICPACDSSLDVMFGEDGGVLDAEQRRALLRVSASEKLRIGTGLTSEETLALRGKNPSPDVWYFLQVEGFVELGAVHGYVPTAKGIVALRLKPASAELTFHPKCR